VHASSSNCSCTSSSSSRRTCTAPSAENDPRPWLASPLAVWLVIRRWPRPWPCGPISAAGFIARRAIPMGAVGDEGDDPLVDGVVEDIACEGSAASEVGGQPGRTSTRRTFDEGSGQVDRYVPRSRLFAVTRSSRRSGPAVVLHLRRRRRVRGARRGRQTRSRRRSLPRRPPLRGGREILPPPPLWSPSIERYVPKFDPVLGESSGLFVKDGPADGRDMIGKQ
jgi:hypothetical protein